MGCGFCTVIFCEWNSSAVLKLCLALSSNFLHGVLATLSVTSSGTAILDAIEQLFIIWYHNIYILFGKSVQDYIVHMDMEIVIFVYQLVKSKQVCKTITVCVCGELCGSLVLG